MNKEIKVLLLSIFNNQMMQGFEEIGIGYIASYLRSKGYEVCILSEHIDSINYEKIAEYNMDIIGMPVYSVSRDDVYSFIEKIRPLVPSL